MIGDKKPKSKFFPFLYLVAFFVFMYSINDMETSTNAYQAQGDRTLVYVFLIGILGLLGLYMLWCWKKEIKLFSPSFAVILITGWVIFDNLLLGNILDSSNLWASLTHGGLSLWWLLALVFGYYYPKDNHLKGKQMMIFILSMFVYWCIQLLLVAFKSNQEHEQTTILNLIYRILVFVPAIYLLENKSLRNFIIVGISFLTVVSMKRGAIIILIVMLLISFFASNRDKKDVSKKIGWLLLGSIFAFIIFFIADKMTEGFLSYRFSSEQLMYGSSRSEKYAQAFEEIVNRDVGELFFGIGSGKRSGVHNEILEFLYTFGLIGLILYLGLIVSMIVRSLKLFKDKSKYASQYAMIVSYFVIVGLYSGVYFVHGTFYLMLVLGMIEGRVKKEHDKEISWDNNASRR